MIYACTEIRRKLLDTLFTHPIEYGQLLMVIGYEPAPPIIKRNLMGERVLALPSIVSYVNHIYSVDGITGLSPGLSPRLIMCLLRHVTEKKVDECFVLWNMNENETKINENLLLIKKITRDIVASIITNIITHPFHVVAIRSMAQFIGKETKYVDVWSSLKIIYTEQGVDGLFSGLIPRMIRDLSNVIILTSLSFAIKKYLTHDKTHQRLLQCISSLVVRNLTYPFHVVATCMAVNDIGLKAGSPPALPIFTQGWKNCWNYLSQTNQLKRGSFPILRYSKIPEKPTVISETIINEEVKTDPVIEETAAEVLTTVNEANEEIKPE